MKNESVQASPALTNYVWGSVVGAAVTALLLWLDPRVLAGEALWLKPLKFFVSSAIYAATLEFGFRWVRGFENRMNLIRRIVAWGLSFEMLAICGQAARGVKSHFNFTTGWDAAVFTAMGIVISVVVLAGFVGIAHLWKSPRGTRALREAYVWGFLIFTVAAFSGASMASPTPEQVLSHETMTIRGSHFVGAVEGEARTLVLTGWNAESGDLRVAHFVGMHVIHFLLLLVGILRLQQADLDDSRSVWKIRVAALAGFTATAAVFFQALAGQSILSLVSWYFPTILLSFGICLIVGLSAVLRPSSRLMRKEGT
jgi:hypothetical protein